tara:strand:+ start:481 stop:981 length:501 start_codon:yes stop_codon:yes gene_type:complete
MVSLETIALEIQLAGVLARMIGIPLRIGQAIYLSPKSEHSRLDILRNAAQSRLAVAPGKEKTELGMQQIKALKQVTKIVRRASDLVNRRHRVVHDEWNFSDREKAVTRKKLDGKPGNPRVAIPLTEVGLLVTDMRKLIDDAHALAESFREHPPFMARLKKDSTKSG